VSTTTTTGRHHARYSASNGEAKVALWQVLKQQDLALRVHAAGLHH
jgi:hypothetical protein